MNPTLNNPYNQLLQARRDALGGAWRFALAPGCNPGKEPGTRPAPTLKQQRGQLLHVPINAFTAGDNQIIPTLTGRKLIYEIFVWNVAAQTLQLWQGASATGILLTQLTAFPSLSGITLGFNGSFAQPHWEIDPGQPLTLTLANSSQVDGFIVYRIADGSD
jgi:hypothetical protein